MFLGSAENARNNYKVPTSVWHGGGMPSKSLPEYFCSSWLFIEFFVSEVVHATSMRAFHSVSVCT